MMYLNKDAIVEKLVDLEPWYWALKKIYTQYNTTSDEPNVSVQLYSGDAKSRPVRFEFGKAKVFDLGDNISPEKRKEMEEHFQNYVMYMLVDLTDDLGCNLVKICPIDVHTLTTVLLNVQEILPEPYHPSTSVHKSLQHKLFQKSLSLVLNSLDRKQETLSNKLDKIAKESSVIDGNIQTGYSINKSGFMDWFSDYIGSYDITDDIRDYIMGDTDDLWDIDVSISFDGEDIELDYTQMKDVREYIKDNVIDVEGQIDDRLLDKLSGIEIDIDYISELLALIESTSEDEDNRLREFMFDYDIMCDIERDIKYIRNTMSDLTTKDYFTTEDLTKIQRFIEDAEYIINQ